MADSPWRSPRVPADSALLLLPDLPDRACVRASSRRWRPALERQGVLEQRAWEREPSKRLVVVSPLHVGKAIRCGADLVLLDGRIGSRRLTLAGFQVSTYVARRAAGGVVQIVPTRGVRGPRPAPAGGWRRRARQTTVEMVRRLSGRFYVTVASRGDTRPAVVTAAAPAVGEVGPVVLLVGGGSARRRSAFLAGVPGRGGQPVVVKLAPAPEEERGRREQAVLSRLAGVPELARFVPHALGCGDWRGFVWSVESMVRGRPLPIALADAREVPDALAVLDTCASWFTRLAALTTTRPDWGSRPSYLPLRGEHRSGERLRAELGGVPGVVVHGDVGTGGNVFVDGILTGVIDWETAVDAELPLTDLLPLLGLALAAVRGHHEPGAAARYVLRACAGEEADSAWLLSHVRTYLRTLGIPLTQAGRLGHLAWAYQASMPLVHDELVTAAGGTPVPWTTAADIVSRRWASFDRLGSDWSALSRSGGA